MELADASLSILSLISLYLITEFAVDWMLTGLVWADSAEFNALSYDRWDDSEWFSFNMLGARTWCELKSKLQLFRDEISFRSDRFEKIHRVGDDIE